MFDYWGSIQECEIGMQHVALLLMFVFHTKMVVMTIPYGYFSCMYSLLFVDSSIILRTW